MEVAASVPESTALAFVGVMVADGSQGRNAAFSQAGQFFQERLLLSLARHGLRADDVYSQRPVASYPTDPRLWFRGATGTVAQTFRIVLLPFVNFGPLKTLSVTTGLLVDLLLWGRCHRRCQHRVIVLYNLAAPPGIVSVVAARLISASVVAIVADIQIPGSGMVPNTILRRVEHRLQTIAMRKCDGLVVLTRAMALDFAPGVPYIQMEGAVPDVQDGSDSVVVPETVVRSDPNAGIIIMYAGGLSELKGIPLLLRAMAALSGEQYRLWVTGDGPLRRVVEEASRADHRIKYWGYAPYSDVGRLMQQATVLVNPHSARHASSRYLFPSKLIEYLATGTPVITTGSTPEVQEYAGVAFVLPDEDPATLVAAIQRVAAMSPSELAGVGARAREYVSVHKSWSTQGRRIANFIRTVLRSSQAS